MVTTPIPVRLPDEMIARLDAAAKRIGSNRAALIRFCVQTWLQHFEKRKEAALPPNWEEIIDSFDGRKKSTVDYLPGSKNPTVGHLQPYKDSQKRRIVMKDNSFNLAVDASAKAGLASGVAALIGRRESELSFAADAPSEKTSPPTSGTGSNSRNRRKPPAPAPKGRGD